MKNAIVLCSGGLDSVTTAFLARKKLGYERITFLFFDYGQRSVVRERECSKQNAIEIGANFQEIDLKSARKIKSMLTSKEKTRQLKKKDLRDTREEGDKWYVPSRNIIFLSHALSFAEERRIYLGEMNDIFVGFKNEGREPFPDATSEFVDAFNSLAHISTKGKFKILAPLLKEDKEDVVKIAESLGVDLKKTFSCYVGRKKHCGTCLACRLRQQGFYWAGVKDPTDYVAH